MKTIVKVTPCGKSMLQVQQVLLATLQVMIERMKQLS
jgi:hypothetical protein